MTPNKLREGIVVILALHKQKSISIFPEIFARVESELGVKFSENGKPQQCSVAVRNKVLKVLKKDGMVPKDFQFIDEETHGSSNKDIEHSEVELPTKRKSKNSQARKATDHASAKQRQKASPSLTEVYALAQAPGIAEKLKRLPDVGVIDASVIARMCVMVLQGEGMPFAVADVIALSLHVVRHFPIEVPNNQWKPVVNDVIKKLNAIQPARIEEVPKTIPGGVSVEEISPQRKPEPVEKNPIFEDEVPPTLEQLQIVQQQAHERNLFEVYDEVLLDEDFGYSDEGKFIGKEIDFEPFGIDPRKRTLAGPGSEEKVLVLAARYQAGVPFWNEEDAGNQWRTAKKKHMGRHHKTTDVNEEVDESEDEVVVQEPEETAAEELEVLDPSVEEIFAEEPVEADTDA